MNSKCNPCCFKESKENISSTLVNMTLKNNKKMNCVWIEAAGCSGNIISFLNAENPDAYYFLTQMVNLKYNNSIMGSEGEIAYEQLLNTLDSEFILIIDGAISTKYNGTLNIIAHYNGKAITALEAIKKAGEKAKYIIAVGTCASFGGISAAKPNPAECKPVYKILDRTIINLPGCPCNPRWIIGTTAHLLLYGIPNLDNKGRPLIFYSTTIHDTCQRRSYFDKGIFAKKLGDKECMFKLGCRGPVTRADCAINKWNSEINWPIQDNTPCIGCANEYFPDKMEPFVRY